MGPKGLWETPLPRSCYTSAAQFSPMLWDRASALLLNTDSPFCPLCTSPEMATSLALLWEHFVASISEKAKSRRKDLNRSFWIKKGLFVHLASLRLQWHDSMDEWCPGYTIHFLSISAPMPTPLSHENGKQVFKKTNSFSKPYLQIHANTYTVGFYFIQK